MFWAIMVARVGEEVEPEHGLDGGVVDAFGPRPVEVAHRGEAADAAAGEAAFEAATGAFLLLTLREMFQELGDAPPAFRGEGDDIVQVGGGVAQAEGGELVSEWGHPASPHRVGVA
jgi:hypothetical protein